MKASDWREHAAQCRRVAATIEEPVARRVLLEAADDYLAMADRETGAGHPDIPAYQLAALARRPGPGVRSQ